MGAMWFDCITIYGYKIIKPKNKGYSSFAAKQLQKLDETLPESYVIMNLVNECHSRMEGDMDQLIEDYGSLIVGFVPSPTPETFIEQVNSLKEFIKSDPDLKKLKIEKKPGFHSGLELNRFIENEKYDDEDTNSTKRMKTNEVE